MSEEQENEEADNAALERITSSDDIDAQIVREVWRYWNDKVKEGKNKRLMKSLRRRIVDRLED